MALRTLAVVLGVWAAGGCKSNKDRALNPMEALHYKRQLVREHWQELSESQRYDLGNYQGRTRSDIDEYFERLRADFARERAADEKRLREDLEGEKKPGNPTLPPSPGGAGT